MILGLFWFIGHPFPSSIFQTIFIIIIIIIIFSFVAYVFSTELPVKVLIILYMLQCITLIELVTPIYLFILSFPLLYLHLILLVNFFCFQFIKIERPVKEKIIFDIRFCFKCSTSKT